MKNEIRTLNVRPASPDGDSESPRARVIGTAQFAENIKSTARRAAVQSWVTMPASSAFGCVDWFRYPDSSDTSGAKDRPRR